MIDYLELMTLQLQCITSWIVHNTQHYWAHQLILMIRTENGEFTELHDNHDRQRMPGRNIAGFLDSLDNIEGS